jgi:hypothetical protein
MRINWDSFDYEKYVSALPQIVRLYLGDALKPKSSEGAIDFFYEDSVLLRVYPRIEAIGPETFKELAGKLTKETSAGLIISYQDSPFRIHFFSKGPQCWVPVALWGWKQVQAIVQLNRQPLDGLVPTIDYNPKPGSSNFGTGTALWTDIVHFVSIGVQIGIRLGMNPVAAMKQIIRDVDHCFQHWNEGWTHEKKVGADGWYHFFGNDRGSNAVELGISVQNEIRAVLNRDFYSNTDLHLAMGANEVASCELDRGGPYDLDSIVAYKLITTKQFWKYDLRATQQIVSNRVDSTDARVWESMGSFSFNGVPLSVYGHTDYPLSRS